MGELVRQRAESLAILEAIVAGKPIRDTRAEVLKVAEMFDYREPRPPASRPPARAAPPARGYSSIAASPSLCWTWSPEVPGVCRSARRWKKTPFW